MLPLDAMNKGGANFNSVVTMHNSLQSLLWDSVVHNVVVSIKATGVISHKISECLDESA